MPSPVTSYTDSIFEKFNRYAAWPPNTRLRLGDFGTLKGNLFTYRGNLESFGIKFGHFAGPLGTMKHSSGYKFGAGGGIEGQAAAAGPLTTAKATLGFKGSGAFVFEATGSRDYEISQKWKLAEDLLRLIEAKVWDPNWYVIENLTKVEQATIIVADSDGVSLGVSAEGGIPLAGIQLAGLRGSLHVVSSEGDYTAFLSEQALTPTFQLLRVKPGILDWLKKLIRPVPEHKEDEVLEWQSKEWREKEPAE